MSISFNEIPNAIRVPLVYAEFDNSRANQGGALQAYQPLLVGQKLPAGTQAALEPVVVTSKEQAQTLFGNGSVLADMVEFYFANNKIQKLTCVAQDDDGAGALATGSVLFAGTATAAGTVSAMIGGRSVKVGVASGDTPTDIVAALVAAMATQGELTVLSAPNLNTSQLDFTAKNAGEHANETNISFNHFEGESFPAGISATITPMSGGTANPDIDDVWPVLDPDEQYILFCHPYSDAQNLGKIETELSDRFGALRATDGYGIVGKRGTFGTLSTLGDSRNSQFTTIVPAKGPMSPWQFAAATTGVIAGAAEIDPARPFQTLTLSKILAPKAADKFSFSERNLLLYDGVSTWKVDSGGNVILEGVITTFKENSFGAPDESYTYLNSPLTLSFLRFDLSATLSSKYPRHKLADDGTRFDAGQVVATPNVLRAEVINKFLAWERKGLVEGFSQFKDELIVERNADNPNRIDILMGPDLVNQLRVIGIKMQFLL